MADSAYRLLLDDFVKIFFSFAFCLKIVLILLFSLKDYFKLCICVSIGMGVQVPAELLDPS